MNNKLLYTCVIANDYHVKVSIQWYYVSPKCSAASATFFYTIILQNKKREVLQSNVFKDIPVIYLSINPFVDIGISYSFWEYHYLKDKMILSLSLMPNIVCFDTGCLVTLCNNSFFQAQAPNIPIRKIVMSITTWDLGVNKHIIDYHTISDIYILTKDNS